MRRIALALSLGLAVPMLHAQTFTYSTLASFNNATVGSQPQAPPMQASDGNFYGISNGGVNSSGVVYKLTPSGQISALYSFCPGTDNACPTGAGPVGSLVQGPDGALYGVTYSGGSSAYTYYGSGTIFRLTLAGVFQQLYAFCTEGDENCPDGIHPQGGLALGSDGNLYGMTNAGGMGYDGTIYSISPSGTGFTVLHSFKGLDGGTPQSTLIQGTDGNFYGTTSGGGQPPYDGTVFRIGAAGGSTFTSIYSFCSANSSCPDGAGPIGYLAEGSDGRFYGGTTGGGTNNVGTFFAVTSGGTLSVLDELCPQNSCLGGGIPWNAYAATDGNIYFNTVSGSNNAHGAIDQITLSGQVTPIPLCDANDVCNFGSNPVGVIQSSTGSLVGADYGGGDIGGGEVFAITASPALPAPIQLSLSQTSVNTGTPVTLSWKVTNGFSLTQRQCYAFVQGGAAGAGSWTGKQTGTYSSSSKLYTGSASITPTAAGSYTYALECGGSESGFATLKVSGAAKAATSTTLTIAPNPVTIGSNATLTATVTKTGGTATPTGAVTFSANGITIVTANLNSSGVAKVSAPANGFPAGTYPVIATYAGDANFSASTSNTVHATLVYATSVALVASPTTVTQPASVTLTATVKRNGASGVPTDKVTFLANGQPLATVTVNASGVATLQASSGSAPVGTYSVTAQYLGDGTDGSATSSAVNVTVKP